jgi:uncharacterized protein (TIGR02452 family)
MAPSRTSRIAMAHETLRICEEGFYTIESASAEEGQPQRIDISEPLQRAIEGARHYHFSESLPSITESSSDAQRKEISCTKISVRNISTIEAALDLCKDTTVEGSNENGIHVGVLNFASAITPGGGFLGGSYAQEESLCHCSLLYPTLQRFESTPNSYYEINRLLENTGLFTTCAIFSPRVPVIRNPKNHKLLEEPVLVSFVTIPAPNKNACIGMYDEADIDETLEDRIWRALEIFEDNGCSHLVLGAFGCGVFGNDPVFVAETSKKLLEDEFRGIFETAVFAVLATGATDTIDAFMMYLAVNKQPEYRLSFHSEKTVRPN